MIRSTLLTLVVITFGATSALADGYAHGRRLHHQSYAGAPSAAIAVTSPYRGHGVGAGTTGTLGLTFGNGQAYPIYGYGGYYRDPYARGRFEIPDLANDPYYQWQYKFDSHFPGRYTRGADGRMYRHTRKGFFGGW